MAKPLAAAAPGVVRRPVKRLFRGFGVATSDFRPLPDYLIIGTHRGGTTSLHEYLQQHPCVGPNFPRLQNVKGVRYFDQNYFRGIGWYRSHFPTMAYRSYLRRLHREPVLSGDASPYYLFHPAAAERAAKEVPQAKIIALLRNPIERAYSHWKRERRDGTEPLERFEDAVAAEPGRLAGEVERILSDDRYYSYAHENFSYISQGLYLDSLRRWLEHFPREHVHIDISERFLENPQAVYDGVLRFLGLPPFALRDAKRLNVTGHQIGQGLETEARRELTARIAPHNRRLEEYLGIKLGWDG
jgi:Sulfotransferase domain